MARRSFNLYVALWSSCVVWCCPLCAVNRWVRNRCYDRAVTTVLFDLAGRESRARAAEDQASNSHSTNHHSSGGGNHGAGEGDGAAVFAVCTSVRRAPTSKQRPCPMNTVKLQLEASTQLRMASERVMKVKKLKRGRSNNCPVPHTCIVTIDTRL